MVKACIGRETMQVCRINSSVQLYGQMSLKHHSRTSSHACEIFPQKVRKALSPSFVFACCSRKRSLLKSVSTMLYQNRNPAQRSRRNLNLTRRQRQQKHVLQPKSRAVPDARDPDRFAAS
jgi:hypothetical protein